MCLFHFPSFLVTVGLFMICLACGPSASQTMTIQETDTIRMGRVNLSFYALTGELVKQLLEEEGYRVKVTEASHPDIYSQLGAGELDLLAGTWLPNAHGNLFDQHGEDAQRLAVFYDNARLYWAVPAFVPETAVAAVADLKESSVVERMTKTIAVVGPGSGLETGSQQIMDSYGLAEEGYELVTLPSDEWAATLDTAVAQNNWTVIGLWQPQYLNEQYDVRPLDEPQELLGGQDTCYLIARNAFVEQLDENTADLLRNIRLDISTITQLDYQVNIEGQKLEEVIRQWRQEHAQTIAQWKEGGNDQ